MKKPKSFFAISEEMILKFMTKNEFRAKVRVAVDNLTNSRLPNIVEATIIEFGDERILRGNLNRTNIEISIVN